MVNLITMMHKIYFVYIYTIYYIKTFSGVLYNTPEKMTRHQEFEFIKASMLVGSFIVGLNKSYDSYSKKDAPLRVLMNTIYGCGFGIVYGGSCGILLALMFM